MLDLIIKHANVYNGSGGVCVLGDVGVRGDMIDRLGTINEEARRVIDAKGLVLCPGFIDVHTHADRIAEYPYADNFLCQGVTTVVSGNCGFSSLSTRQLLAEIEAARPAINFATLAGHGSVRKAVMGERSGEPSAEEMVSMKRLIDRAMKDGAVGMSTGLFYRPGAYAKTAEIIELAKVVSSLGGIYASHIRSAGGRLFEAIDEAARVGREAGISVEISHLKVLHRAGRTQEDRAEKAIGHVRGYRDKGVNISFDAYPYPASFTFLSAVIVPPRFFDGGELREKLKDRTTIRQIKAEAAECMAWNGGPENIIVLDFSADKSVEGLSLEQIAERQKKEAAEVALEMIARQDPDCMLCSMRDDDVEKIVCSEEGVTASDGKIVAAGNELAHPRNYGTFPRVIRHYVLEKGLLTMGQAIEKMTSGPARKFNIADRGTITVGKRADMVIMNKDNIAEVCRDRYRPGYPAGIEFVIVNGRIAYEQGCIRSERNGQVIRGSAAQ